MYIIDENNVFFSVLTLFPAISLHFSAIDMYNHAITGNTAGIKFKKSLAFNHIHLELFSAIFVKSLI